MGYVRDQKYRDRYLLVVREERQGTRLFLSLARYALISSQLTVSAVRHITNKEECILDNTRKGQ
jgi:hypothetical protein